MKTWKCHDCESEFYSPDTVYRAGRIGNGSENWEEDEYNSVCPVCGSGEINEAYFCADCEKEVDDGELDEDDLCFECRLEAEIAQLKKDKLEFNAQCFHKDETILVLKNRITELEFDNRSLVEQMNQMALKQNQEIIEWHQHPLYPETSRCCIVECTDNCFYVAHHSYIDGWLNSFTYEQLSNVKSWAYLPIGKNYLKAQEEES